MIKLADSKPELSVVYSGVGLKAGDMWRHVRTAMRWFATAALIGWLAMTADWRAVLPAIAQASIPWLITAAILYLASQFASVARWSLLVRAAGLGHSRSRLLAAYFEGMFVNVCLPTTVGGDLLKVLRVGGDQHKRVATSTVVADRATGLAALVVLLAAGWLLKFDRVGYFATSLLAAVVVVALPTAIWLFRVGAKSLDPIVQERDSTLRRQIARFIPLGVRQLAIQTPWPWVFAWAFVVQGLNVATVAVAARSIGIHVSLIEILVAATTVSIAAALPISVAGVGIREASLPLLLAADGVPREMAITLGIALSGIVLGAGLLGGPVHFLAQRTGADGRTNIAPTTIVVGRRSA